MGKIVRYEFIGNQLAAAAHMMAIALTAIFFPLLLIATVSSLIVYLLLTIVKIEEGIERPNEFIGGLQENRFRK